MKRLIWSLGGLIIALGPAHGAFAQMAINTDTAIQPGKGATILRQQLRYFEAEQRAPGPGPGVSLDIEQWSLSTSIIHGLTADATLIFNVNHRFRQIDDNIASTSDRDNGFGDLRVLAKLKLFSENTGPTNTSRLSLLGGLEIRSGDSNFSSDSNDPLLGMQWTKGDGQLGLNASVLWKLNTGGDPDEVHYDGAITWRLYPETFTGGADTAMYGVLELNGIHETNSDDELFLSPGLQYVTGQWAIEATVQIPVWQELDSRPEKDFIVGLSFRMYF